MTNLSLLERIARGERTFRVDPTAPDDERAAFSQLVCDARRLAVAGYLTGLQRPHDDLTTTREHALDVLSPGVTPAGVAALRRAGHQVGGPADLAPEALGSL